MSCDGYSAVNVTAEQVLAIMPFAKKRVANFLDHLNKYMLAYEINTPARQAAFLAQIALESGELQYVREIASGAAYDTGKLAARLGNTPEADGDGQKFRGRGLIQVTGANNYKLCGDALNLNLLDTPELLEQPAYAVQSACWFWASRGLNALADKHEFQVITKKINGGLNHYAERCVYWERAREALGDA
jgi:putative chitinase